MLDPSTKEVFLSTGGGTLEDVKRAKNNIYEHNKKLSIWMQGGLHGDEPAGTEAMLYLIYTLLNDTKYNYMIDRTLRDRILKLPNNKNVTNSANIDVSQLKKVLLANTKHLNMKDATFIIPDNYGQKYYYSGSMGYYIF